MERKHIGRSQQLVKAPRELDTRGRLGDEGVEAHNRSREGANPVGDGTPDSTEADDSDRETRERRNRLEPRPRSPVVARELVALQELAVQSEHQRDGVGRDLLRCVTRGVEDSDAAVASRLEIDGIEPDPSPCDDLYV